jgi:hypothetical protein
MQFLGQYFLIMGITFHGRVPDVQLARDITYHL